MHENKIILLVILDGKKWHYLAVKSLPALCREKTSKHYRDSYWLNCLHSIKAVNKLKEHENVCKNHYYCYIEMPEEDKAILKCNHGENSMKILFIIYVDMEFLLEKIDTCHSNLKESSTSKINNYTASGYLLFTHCSFDTTKNKHDHYRVKDCMKSFSKYLIVHATKIINHEEKEIIPLTNEENKSYRKQKICHMCRKKFCTNDEKYHKVKDHCHYTGKYRSATNNVCNLRYTTPKEIPIVFHNSSKCDYHLIIKELAEEFEGQFECLGENTDK